MRGVIQKEERSADSKGSTVMTVVQVAHAFQVAPFTVREWAREGRIPVVRLGRLLRFRKADIDAVLRGGLATLAVAQPRRNVREGGGRS